MFTTFHQLGTLESIKHSCETLGLRGSTSHPRIGNRNPMERTPHLQFTLHWLLATLCKGLDHAQGPRCGPSWCLIPCDGSFRFHLPEFSNCHTSIPWCAPWQKKNQASGSSSPTTSDGCWTDMGVNIMAKMQWKPTKKASNSIFSCAIQTFL